MSADNNSIILKKIIRKSTPKHGGAWKVALADFAIAMMAFFLVLWLMATTSQEEKQQIAHFFQHPEDFSQEQHQHLSGDSLIYFESQRPLTRESQKSLYPSEQVEQIEETVEDLVTQIESRRLAHIKNLLETEITDNAVLQQYFRNEQITLQITNEGLLIELIDNNQNALFEKGSADLRQFARHMLEHLAIPIAKIKNKISISGHTDGANFGVWQEYTNWNLSFERANQARVILEQAGIDRYKTIRVVGMSSRLPHDRKNPRAAVNRRISLTILSKKAEYDILINGGIQDIDPQKPYWHSDNDILQAIRDIQQNKNQIPTLDFNEPELSPSHQGLPGDFLDGMAYDFEQESTSITPGAILQPDE